MRADFVIFLYGRPPFTSTEHMNTYNKILKGIDMVDFPKHMSRSAVTLIKRLCRDIPTERLGYQKGGIEDIKKHKYGVGPASTWIYWIIQFHVISDGSRASIGTAWRRQRYQRR